MTWVALYLLAGALVTAWAMPDGGKLAAVRRHPGKAALFVTCWLPIVAIAIITIGCSRRHR